MKFKEFVNWCNDRACDGCWGIMAFVNCKSIIVDVRNQPFWKREKYWQEEYANDVLENIVNPLDEKRKEAFESEVADSG